MHVAAVHMRGYDFARQQLSLPANFQLYSNNLSWVKYGPNIEIYTRNLMLLQDP